MTAEEARKITEKVNAKEEQKKWNLLDTLQLAWYEMWIKYHAKRGERNMTSLSVARRLVIEVLEEKKGFHVRSNAMGTIVYW